MKAVVLDRFGGPEVPHETETDLPRPPPDRSGIRVRAAGVNPLDGKIRSGALEAVFPTLLPSIPGNQEYVASLGATPPLTARD